MTGPDQLAKRLGMGAAPEAWRAHWESFQEWVAAGRCPTLRWELSPDAAEVFDLPAGALAPLRDVFAVIRGDDALAQMSDFWHYALYHLPGEIGDNPSAWPVPEERLGAPSRLYGLAMMVSGSRHAVDNFATTRVPGDVVRATLGYIGRYTRDVKDRRGVWGLESVGWLQNYVRAGIFRLGRLTFRASRYTWPYRAYRNRATGEVLTFCEPPTRYRADGLADGTNGIHDPDGWQPVLELTDTTARGCIVSPGHRAVREPVTLPLAEWQPVTAPGDQRVEVHIAGGSRMPEAECADAYRRALEFFPRQYPGTHFPLFTCYSWVLDPQLAQILPPASNIARFQKPYRLLPMHGDERQTYDLVFGSPDADISRAARNTTLRRAIAEHVEAGHRMRSTGAYMLWDDAVDFVR